ncbi:MAG: cytochrome c [Rhodocyclaceae bacterium]|nr:cytochrome c [Rhodocyclaceae bacterium]
MNSLTKWVPIVLALVALPASAGDVAAGKAKSATCAACHGADGNSPTPDFPKIAGQHQDYLMRALLDYKNGNRKNPIMQGQVANLSKADLADLAAWFASRKGLHTVR